MLNRLKTFGFLVGFRELLSPSIFLCWFVAWDWAGILVNMRVDNNKTWETVGPDTDTSCTVDNILYLACLQTAAIMQQTLYTAVLPAVIVSYTAVLPVIQGFT